MVHNVDGKDECYSEINDEMESRTEDEPESRTKLYSHANMPVRGCHTYILSEMGMIVDVNVFKPDKRLSK